MTDSCQICDKVARARSGQNPYLIHEFKHSILVVGDHQFFPGYSVLLAKAHVREPFELEPQVQEEMFRELMSSAQAIQHAFNPWKMNYSCYGNQVPHVHWHLFPRTESDPQHKLPPWIHADKFDQYKTSARQAQEVRSRIQAHTKK